MNMEKSNPDQRQFSWLIACQWMMLALCLLVAVGCTTDSTEPDEESGIIGTGIMLRGTVSEQKQLASADLEIRAQSGDRSSVGISRDGQYDVESLSGQGPWLLRSNLGNDNYQYGIAHASGIAHVHSYTDLMIRGWFLGQHGINELDRVFDARESLPLLPTRQEFLDIASRYFALVKLVLQDYGLTEEDLLDLEFRNDSTTVDLFLNANPVVLDGRDLTIVKTNPRNNSLSFFNSDILSPEEDQTPTQPPSMPQNLRVFGSSSNGILLAWDSPEDNSPVISYSILRNNELIATTPYSTYEDQDIDPDIDYRYEVLSNGIDGSRSVSSSVITNSGTVVAGSSPLLAAPQNLTAEATTQRVELIWTQADFNDVVAFNVLRGLTIDTMSLLTRVTSTRMVDATVSSGIEYCYAIVALDASGINPSAPSEPACLRTDGIVIEPPKRPLNGVPELAGLSVPNTDAMSCDAQFPNYTVSDAAVSISPGCYLVEQNISVSDFGVLTFQPGVVLKFAMDTGVNVEFTGSLISVGTNAMPVVLTGTRPTRGWWRGVSFNRTERRLNKISHTVIEYAGGRPKNSSVWLESSTNATAYLSIDNSLIRYGSGYGISIPGLDAGLLSFSANLITDNQRAAGVNASSLPAINDGSDFYNNDLNFIYVARAHYDMDLELYNPGIPIELGSIDQYRRSPPRKIIIHEGVELRFITGAAFNVTGELDIRGTAQNPVRLTSKNPNRGGWEGLQLADGAYAKLSHVIIENAGAPSEENPAGASLFAKNARLSLDNVSLRSSASYGFLAAGSCVSVDKFEQVSRDNNALEDIVDLSSLVDC